MTKIKEEEKEELLNTQNIAIILMALFIALCSYLSIDVYASRSHTSAENLNCRDPDTGTLMHCSAETKPHKTGGLARKQDPGKRPGKIPFQLY